MTSWITTSSSNHCSELSGCCVAQCRYVLEDEKTSEVINILWPIRSLHFWLRTQQWVRRLWVHGWSFNSSDEQLRHHYCQHRRQWWAKQPRSQSSGHTTLKPIPPMEYDGSADARAYHQFVKESEAYLCDGKVHHWQWVFVLLYYLAGKAYNFYTQKTGPYLNFILNYSIIVFQLITECRCVELSLIFRMIRW